MHSKEFEDVYIKYEQSNIGKKVKAREIWNLIIDCQIETGTPYILFKDACNQKSNQSNLGTIKSSNLCCEIVQYTSKTETAVCNLASVSLPKCIKDGEFDFEHLRQVVSEITGNLDKVIQFTFFNYIRYVLIALCESFPEDVTIYLPFYPTATMVNLFLYSQVSSKGWIGVLVQNFPTLAPINRT